MIYLEIAVLFGCIIYAAKLGGVGVGMAGGLGMAIAVFGLGLKPGEIPVDVILIILTVIFAISCMPNYCEEIQNTSTFSPPQSLSC